MDGCRHTIAGCQSGVWKKVGPSFNASISPDYGVVDLAGGLKMTWQRFIIQSCADWYKWQDSGYEAGCSVRFNFQQPFSAATYYVSAIGQDTAQGAAYGANMEGSEMSFGVQAQDRNGVNLRINRVFGGNGAAPGSFTEYMGLTIYAIGQ